MCRGASEAGAEAREAAAFLLLSGHSCLGSTPLLQCYRDGTQRRRVPAVRQNMSCCHAYASRQKRWQPAMPVSSFHVCSFSGMARRRRHRKERRGQRSHACRPARPALFIFKEKCLLDRAASLFSQMDGGRPLPASQPSGASRCRWYRGGRQYSKRRRGESLTLAAFLKIFLFSFSGRRACCLLLSALTCLVTTLRYSRGWRARVQLGSLPHHHRHAASVALSLPCRFLP